MGCLKSYALCWPTVCTRCYHDQRLAVIIAPFSRLVIGFAKNERMTCQFAIDAHGLVPPDGLRVR
jgi:hypothetical protein